MRIARGGFFPDVDVSVAARLGLAWITIGVKCGGIGSRSRGHHQRKVEDFGESWSRRHVDGPHEAFFAVRTTPVVIGRGWVFLLLVRFLTVERGLWDVEQLSNPAQLPLAMRIGEKSIVANSHEAVGKPLGNTCIMKRRMNSVAESVSVRRRC